MNICDLINALANIGVHLESLRDIMGAIREEMPRLPQEAGDAVHRLLNCLDDARLADFIETANNALDACEQVEDETT